MTQSAFRIILFVLLSLASVACAQSIQFENQPIERIEVVPESVPVGAYFDTNSVLARMKTHAGDHFSHVDFDNDLKVLAQDFDRVIPKLETVDGKLYITLRIWPRPTIRGIQWCGNERMDSGKLLKELGIPLGCQFDRQAFNKAFHKLKAYYVKKGFFEAELDYEAILDCDTSEVDIQITIKEGRAGKIKKIVFCGFTCEEEDALVEMIMTKKYTPILSWFNNEGIYHEEMVQQDQFVILNYIHNEGYADARVDIEVCEATQRDRIVVTITLDRGEQYFFGDISIKGNTLFCTDDLMGRLPFCPGDPYSPDALRDAIRAMTNTYGRRGYIDTIIDFEPTLVEESCSYNVEFTVDEGDRYCVGMLKVFGNCSTQTKVILHETLLVPGEVFNIEKLQKTEQRLRNVGYFKSVNVYAVKSEADSCMGGNYRDVHIEVEETNTGYMSTQFGLSSADALFGGISVSEKNFNYKGLGRVWKEGYSALRGGGEYVHLNATLGTKSRKYEMGWAKPYFMDSPWTVGFDADQTTTRYIAHDYDINAMGFTIHGTHQSGPFLRTGVHYRLRNSIVDVSEWDPNEEKHWFKDKDGKYEYVNGKPKMNDEWNAHENHMVGVRRAKDLDGLVSAAGTTLTFDSTNHPVCPTKGFRSKLMGEVAGLGGQYEFFALAYTSSYYRKAPFDGLFKARFDFRFLIPYGNTKRDDIPLDERLYLGGDSLVRGYRNYRLGPVFKNADDKPDKDDPKGGNSLQFISFEYDKEITKRFTGLLFIEGGALTESVLSFSRFYLAYGYGVRMNILDSLPPITIGMGYPVNPKNKSEVKKFFFQMGGRF